MNRRSTFSTSLVVAVAFATQVTSTSAAIRYVNVNNTTPSPPFASWTTAATNIQDAVDAAAPGEEVLVTNGVYQTGGRVVYGALNNRVAVTQPLVLRSVNGPVVTEINGGGAARCVYLTNGALLAGFTLSQGATLGSGDDSLERTGGGVWGESTSAVVSNCIISSCNATRWGGGAAYVSLLNSTITASSSGYGGGAFVSALTNCVLSNNYSGFAGGGAGDSTLDHCLMQNNTAVKLGGGTKNCTASYCEIINNTAQDNTGGGAYEGTLDHCRLINNQSTTGGGGASDATLNNCTLIGNTASGGGGAAAFCGLNNCVVAGNSSGSSGGAALYCGLNNCTVTGNSAPFAGGVDQCSLNNSILYYNTALNAPNYSGSSFNHSSTTPAPAAGVGNITTEPLLTDMAHISSASPCRGAGSAADATGQDIDGQSWASPPSIGCDEYYSGSVTGQVSVAMQATYTNFAVGFAASFSAQIAGFASANRWEFGDGTVVSNRPFASHSWAAPGDFDVVFRADNDSFPAGISATVTVHVVTQPIHYVAAGNATPVAPYTSWATAASNIQDAVDVATITGAQVLVTNGTYETGGMAYGSLSNRVAVTKPLVVRSVNGPVVTTIRGYQVPDVTNGDTAVRCVYLVSGSTLAGFTLTNGATLGTGGGVQCELSAIISNCVIVACAANSSGGGVSGGAVYSSIVAGNYCADSGGGASACFLNRCIVSGNSAANAGGALVSCEAIGCTITNNNATYGGGAIACALRNSMLGANSAIANGGGANGSALDNCTLTGNSASVGGGAAECVLNNSIVFYNAATREVNYSGGTLSFCCTTPLPAGPGNISAEPQLADYAHVSATSPCRAAGSAAHATSTDLDGEAWLAPPSIGCDEFYAGAISGPLSVAVQASQTNLATGFAATFTGIVNGHASANRWDLGDGIILSNRLSAAHAWAAAGDYAAVFTVFNKSNPAGVSATALVHVVSQPVHYVAPGNATPIAPYTSWATAAPDIQSAVEAASVAGALVLVTNGTYQTGGNVVHGMMTNRVAVTKPLRVQSLNGPTATVIGGNPAGGTNAVRCVYLAGGAVLNGFTLTNGTTRPSGDGVTEMSGGGLWCEPGGLVTNCVLAGNSANNVGGGAYSGTLNGCVLSGNSAGTGGGAQSANLNSCTISSNSAFYGGGVDSCTLEAGTIIGNSASYAGGARASLLNRCILTGNHASSGGGGASDSTLNHCGLWRNSSSEGGGGAYFCTLNNCTVTANAYSGADYSTANNCIVYDNSGDNSSYESTFNYCCTVPLPLAGVGNLTNAPLFVNPLANDFRLQTNSPCVNAGHNAYAPPGVDLDGNPRIAGGTVDIGAYELPSPSLLQFQVNASGFTANGTFHLTFIGAANGTYGVWASTNLMNWEWLGTAQATAPGVFEFLDPLAATFARRFYRAGTP